MRYRLFALLVLALIEFCLLIFLLMCAPNYEVAFDFISIFLGITLIFLIASTMYNEYGWREKGAWIPTVLIIAVGIMTIFLVELDLEEGGVLINKITFGGKCEISCREKFRKEVNICCYDNKYLKNKIFKDNFPGDWHNIYCDCYKDIKSNHCDDLLGLCCAKTIRCFLCKLSEIRCTALQNLDKPGTTNESKIDTYKNTLTKLIILDGLALEAFAKAINHCQCTQSQSCSNCCCEDNETDNCNCKQ